MGFLNKGWFGVYVRWAVLPKGAIVPWNKGKGKKGGDKGGGKGKGQGKGKAAFGKRGPVMPAELKGLEHAIDGQPLCFGFNMRSGCQNSVTDGKCKRGKHVCAVKGCFGSHTAVTCIMRPKV